MIRHIIFDCFGTLIDTGNNSIKAVEQILFNVGVNLDAQKFYEDWKAKKRQKMNASVFLNEKTLFEVSLSETFAQYGIEADASKEIKPMIHSLFAERLVFSDVYETLEKLGNENIDIAIGSTTDTDSLLYYLELNKLSFSHIYTSENMQVYKPDINFYKTILSKSGWLAKDCLFVGDSYMDDVYGPQKVGMKTVLLDRKALYKDSELLPQPDFVIHSLLELVNILK
ncbi:MAG: HAD family hydrolase [Lachnospiraceae bacterium]|nr:HAD family hydrolase [Lachnospiraceae bacterium]